MKKKIISLLLCSALLMSIFTICDRAFAADTKHEPVEVEIYAYQMGSTPYLAGMAWADLINKHSDWLKAVCVESISSVGNELMIRDNPDMRGHTVYYGVGDAAYRGVNQFAGNPYKRSKHVLNVSLGLNGMITCNPEVKTVEDMAGKIFAQYSNGAINKFVIALLSYVTPVIRFEDMDANQRFESTLAKRSAATFFGGSALTPDLKQWSPDPNCSEVMARAEYIGFINIPHDRMKALRSEVGGPFEGFYQVPGTIPAGGMGSRQTEDWNVFFNNSAFLADQDMDPEVIREMLRIFAEHADELADLHPIFNMLTNDIMSMYAEPVEMHPAAQAYWESIGVTPKTIVQFVESVKSK
ncbi:hypothetical protein FACS1894187_08030 [Synergistales bacterium]|nr:hypothetical protein FACS1894187_08030 [Synergistales bacterium]